MIRYIPGSPVRGNDFYNRKPQLQTIMDGGWTWVCGQRRIGKTSLLFQLEEAQQADSLSLFLDLTTLEEYNGEGLFEMFLLTHGRLLRKHDIRMKDFPLEHPVECFYQLVSELGDKGKQVAFLWDETERLIDIEKNDPGILNKLRARLCHLRNFRFVISATQLLAELYEQQSELVSSFLHTFHWMPLPVLDIEEAKALLRCEQAGGWETPLPETVVNEAVQWSGGHPLILHELGTQLAENTKHKGNKANTQLLHRCFNRLSHNVNLRSIFQDDYAKLTGDQQYLLKSVINANGEIALEEVISEKDTLPEKIEDALRFLENYSYVTWEADDRIRLRFVFYPKLVQFDMQPPSVADPKKVNQIKRTIFISYSQKDQQYLEELRTHLDSLIRKGEIEAWDDRRIEAGTECLEEIEGALKRAQVAVLMISPGFLNSRFITEKEVPKLFDRANDKGCRVLCLFLKPLAIHNLVDQKLPTALNQKIVDFLISIPNIDDRNTRRALIYSAGLDNQLQKQITFEGAPVQFFQLLVSILRSYGLIEDRRDALTAVLEAAKNYVGQDRRDYCATLIKELRRYTQLSPQNLDTSVNEVTYEIEGEEIKLTKFQGLNKPSLPLSKLTDTERDETLAQCAKEIVRQTRNICLTL